MVLYISMCMCIYTHCEMIHFRSVVSDSFWPHGLLQASLPCPSPTPRACSNSCLLSWWCHPTISSCVIPFSSCLQSFPASGSFPVSWFMAYPILFFTASDFTSITSHITTGRCFRFGSVSPFFLELFLQSSPVACWAPTDLGSLSYSVISFCLFILFMGFSRQGCWSGLPFPSPVDHV